MVSPSHTLSFQQSQLLNVVHQKTANCEIYQMAAKNDKSMIILLLSRVRHVAKKSINQIKLNLPFGCLNDTLVLMDHSHNFLFTITKTLTIDLEFLHEICIGMDWMIVHIINAC